VRKVNIRHQYLADYDYANSSVLITQRRLSRGPIGSSSGSSRSDRSFTWNDDGNDRNTDDVTRRWWSLDGRERRPHTLLVMRRRPAWLVEERWRWKPRAMRQQNEVYARYKWNSGSAAASAVSTVSSPPAAWNYNHITSVLVQVVTTVITVKRSVIYNTCTSGQEEPKTAGHSLLRYLIAFVP